MGRWTRGWRPTNWKDLEPPHFDKASPTCTRCGGMRQIPESIDEERLDVLVPCPMCQSWCLHCGKYVTKKGHICPK